MSPRKFQKIYTQPIAPATTSYLYIDRIVRVGGQRTLGLGGSGGDLGGFGLRTRTFAICGGALVVVSLAHSSGVWGPGRGSGALLCPLVRV